MTTDTPPVHDVNFNGKLDGQDLKKAMDAEEQPGGRTPAERVHGLLTIAGVRNVVEGWNGYMLTQPDIDTKQLEANAARALNFGLTSQLADYKANPEEFVKELRANPPKEYVGKPVLLEADIKSFENFAKTFDQKFKGGVDIKPEEVLGVLSHFGPVFTRPGQQRPPSGVKI